MPFPLAESMRYPFLADEHYAFEPSGPAPRFVSNWADVPTNEMNPSEHKSDGAYTMKGVNFNAIYRAVNGDDLEQVRIYKTG